MLLILLQQQGCYQYDDGLINLKFLIEMESRDDCSSSPLLPGLLRSSPLIVHGTAKPSFLSEPSCHPPPPRSFCPHHYSSNIPGLLPPQGPCICSPLFPECSFPRESHSCVLSTLGSSAQPALTTLLNQEPPSPSHPLSCFTFVHSIYLT